MLVQSGKKTLRYPLLTRLPVKLIVYDHDTFSKDDKMGDSEFDIRPFIDALRMNLHCFPSGTVLTRILPGRENCHSEESCLLWNQGKAMQDMCLRLRNVECGEVEIQLQWIESPRLQRSIGNSGPPPFNT